MNTASCLVVHALKTLGLVVAVIVLFPILVIAQLLKISKQENKRQSRLF